jgi:hypothetical protein
MAARNSGEEMATVWQRGKIDGQVDPYPFSHFASKRQSMQRTTHDFFSIWFAMGREARILISNRTVLETLATRVKQPVVRMAAARCNGAGIGTISFFARRIHDQSIVKLGFA